MTASLSDLIVVASARARPGKEADLESALREVAAPTRAQPGCIEFRLLRVKGDPSTMIGLERWASEACLQDHHKGPHVKRLMERMADILAEPPNIVACDLLDE